MRKMSSILSKTLDEKKRKIHKQMYLETQNELIEFNLIK